MRFSGVGHWLYLLRSERDQTPRNGIFPLSALALGDEQDSRSHRCTVDQATSAEELEMAVRLHENAWMPIPAPSRFQMRDSNTHPLMDKARINGLIRAKAPTLKLPSQRTR
jgi:hypothetical protein